MLYKVIGIAALLEDWQDEQGPAGERRVRGRLEELVDLLWQTDELRIAAPNVVDEARNAVWYLDALYRDGVPEVLEALADELRRLGLELDAGGRPLAFGSWIGGDRDGNPNVGPDSIQGVLDLQHAHGLDGALALVDGLRRDLSSSVRIAGATQELSESLARDLELLPGSSRASGG